ncbi:hypothetical protein C0J52_16867 [Blattella germanica]|nr:hypothetical protein C0J52_16867 [Blattella germanica]
MSQCRLKLSQCYAVLQQSIPANANNTDVLQAVEGLREVCLVLKGRHLPHPLEVEPAYEAGETRVDKQPATVQRSVSPPTQLTLQQRQNQEKQKTGTLKKKDPAAATASHPPPKSEVDMKVFSKVEGHSECVQGAPSKDPLGTGSKSEEKPPFT